MKTITTYKEMVMQLKDKVGNAKKGLLEHGIIDGVFSQMISNETSVSNEDRTDILVSICPWSMDFEKGEMCLGLFGIDEEGTTDLISVTTGVSETDLFNLYSELKTIHENGYYDNVVEYSIFG